MDEEVGYLFLARNSRFLTGLSARFGMTNFYLSCARLSLIYLSTYSSFTYFFFDLFEGVGLGYIEFGYGGAAQEFQMGSGALKLAHFVGYGTHVGSRGYAGAERGSVALDCCDNEFLDLDLHRLQDYLFLFSG